jgi:hypothetical protein
LSFQLLIIILTGMALEIYRLTPSYAQDPYQRNAFSVFMVAASIFVLVAGLAAVVVSIPCIRDRVIPGLKRRCSLFSRLHCCCCRRKLQPIRPLTIQTVLNRGIEASHSYVHSRMTRGVETAEANEHKNNEDGGRKSDSSSDDEEEEDMLKVLALPVTGETHALTVHHGEQHVTHTHTHTHHHIVTDGGTSLKKDGDGGGTAAAFSIIEARDAGRDVAASVSNSLGESFGNAAKASADATANAVADAAEKAAAAMTAVAQSLRDGASLPNGEQKGDDGKQVGVGALGSRLSKRRYFPSDLR